ncbi:MAG: hypothetical protein CBARDCOR_6745 [uncultured Caballeronia sp.]|nr:MAG: hypothetical protein CBARDCOR_6745 [uncultured Caballeronia sp.]
MENYLSPSGGLDFIDFSFCPPIYRRRISFFLTQIIELLQAGKDFSLYLYIFLASMAAPYLPGCLSIILLQTWINRAHCAFVKYLARHMLDRTEKCRYATLKERVESVMARNSYLVIGDYISFVHDLASFLLNSVLRMIVIGFLLLTRLLCGYSLSIFYVYLS